MQKNQKMIKFRWKVAHWQKFVASKRQKAIKISWRKVVMISWLVIALGVNLINPTYAYSLSSTSCNDVEFIFARGSGEALGDVSYRAWQSSITAAMADVKDLKYNFYELGSQSYNDHQYPAVSVSGDALGIATLFGAYFYAGEGQLFGESVREGMLELKIHMTVTSRICPQTKYVLGGYSQGAMVLSKSLPSLDASKILYVATFGDPKLYLPEGEPDMWNHFKTVDACRGVNLSPYRTYVPDCKAYEGVLGSVRPYQPAQYTGKIGAWCNQSDIMCSSGLSIDDHTSYVSRNLYGDAAIYIRKKIATAFPRKVPASANEKANQHDVAFLFDLTGSMQWMAEKYQAEAERLAGLVWRAGGRVALYGYRDVSGPSALEKFCDFDTCTTESFHAGIKSMRFSGGGDDPESVLSSAKIVMRDLKWQQGATKSLLLLTDAGYHSPDRDGTTFDEVVALSLAIDPVNFYTLTPKSQMSKYTELTEATNGATFDIDSEIELSTETIYYRPVAKLNSLSFYGKVGEEFFFDASESYSLDGQTLTYDWDLDGDGKFELIDAGSKVRQTYTETFEGFIKVRVNTNDKSSTMTALVKVEAADEPEEIAKLKITGATLQNSTTAEIEFSTENTEKVLLTIDDAVMGFVKTNPTGGKITVADLTDQATIGLVPYSTAGKRGEVAKVSFADDKLEVVMPEPQKPNSKPGSSSNNSSNNNSGSQNSNPDSQDSAIKQDNQLPQIIPKAPNTGVRQTTHTSGQ